MNRFLVTALCGFVFLCTACTSKQVLVSIDSEKILIDKRYDRAVDAEAVAFLAPYKERIDSLMSPVVGHTARTLEAKRPESTLSNLLADILVWGANLYGEKVSFAVYNMGGIRASFPQGAINVGHVVDVAPFENKICFLTLTGAQVEELFGQMARRGGEGVSQGVRLVLESNGRLKSALLHGKKIEPQANYRIATIDYLAQGNDGLRVFKQATQLVAPQDKDSNARNIIIGYFKDKTLKGQQVDAVVEGRIVVDGE